MKITIARAVILLVILGSSLLLVSAANCSFGQKTSGQAAAAGRAETVVAEQDPATGIGRQTAPAPKTGQIRTGEKARGDPNTQGSESVTAEKQGPEEVFTANVFCAACHYGLDEEELALNHEIWGIGCERCHGESARHRSDENNITPPDIMWPKSKINPMCMMCHPRHEIKHVKDHREFLAGSETIFDPEIDDGSSDGTSAQKENCGDCHAKTHRVNVRNVRWNKMTGELLTE